MESTVSAPEPFPSIDLMQPGQTDGRSPFIPQGLMVMPPLFVFFLISKDPLASVKRAPMGPPRLHYEDG
ncbi:hypothetical protein AVEN_28442-1, partial [Araneus ventricosus]